MLSLIFTKIILLLFYLFYFFMKIIFIFSCSGMFRYVPGCSVMFRVPGFIEAHHSFAYFKMEERRGRRGFRFTEAQQYASRNFRKAFYAIRTGEEGHTGIACAVETEDENNDRIRLVTCSDTWNSVSNSVQMVRFSRKHFGRYRLRPAPSTSVRQCEQFSIIWCEIGGNETWAKRRLLRPKFLNSQEQKTDFLVYTIDGQSCKVLNLKYNKEKKSHDLKDGGEISYKLGGSPIISLDKKYLVGVLKSGGEVCFLFDGVFGE